MVVNGVFRETETSESESIPLIRAYQRVFVLVPEPSADGRFNIVNDMLSITNATQQQINVRANRFHVQSAAN